MFYTVTEGNLS